MSAKKGSNRRRRRSPCVRPVRRKVNLYCEGSGGPGAGWTLSAEWVPESGRGYVLWMRADGPLGYENKCLKKAAAPLDYQAICRDIARFPELRVSADLREEVDVSGLLDHEADKVVATCASDEDTPTPDWTFLDQQPESILVGLREWLGPLYGEAAQTRIAAMQELCSKLDLPADLESAGRAVGWEVGRPVHQVLGRLLRRWREVGHDSQWAKLRPGDSQVLDWISDRVLAPRSAKEWARVLETWISETSKYKIAEGLPLILEKLGDDDNMRVAIAAESPGLLARFRDTAYRAVASNHTPGQPPKHPGIQGINIIRWRLREDIYRQLVSPPWFANAPTVRAVK